MPGTSGLLSPAVVRRVEHRVEAPLGEPRECLELKRIEVADVPRLEVLDLQPRVMAAEVDAQLDRGEFALDVADHLRSSHQIRKASVYSSPSSSRTSTLEMTRRTRDGGACAWRLPVRYCLTRRRMRERLS